MIYFYSFYKSDAITTYCFLKLISAVSKVTKALSKSTMNIPANTGPNEETIGLHLFVNK